MMLSSNNLSSRAVTHFQIASLPEVASLESDMTLVGSFSLEGNPAIYSSGCACNCQKLPAAYGCLEEALQKSRMAQYAGHKELPRYRNDP
jgi:hypothetical protein